MTKINVNSDIEDTLNRAFHMSSIAVALAERVFKVFEHYGDTAYHERRRQEAPGPYDTYLIHNQDVDTLLFTLYEAHAKAREAFDMLTAPDDDDAPAKAAEAA
jgi:hypothetical protein